MTAAPNGSYPDNAPQAATYSGSANALAVILRRCRTVLGNMALENETGLSSIFNRWPISHEPLRADAKNLVPLIDEALFEYHTAFLKSLNDYHDHHPLPQSPTGAQRPNVSVKPMALSDDRTDYFVSIEVGDREITPYVFRDAQFKAEYEAASFRWLLLGEAKPDLMAYSEDGWPVTAPRPLTGAQGVKDTDVAQHNTDRAPAADEVTGDAGSNPAVGAQPSSGLAAIANERQRQIDAEGWSLGHDDEHQNGEMAIAAALFALTPDARATIATPVAPHWRGETIVGRLWPWDFKWWKPKDRRRDLVRAGALIVAEIERLDRASSVTSTARECQFPKCDCPGGPLDPVCAVSSTEEK